MMMIHRIAIAGLVTVIGCSDPDPGFVIEYPAGPDILTNEGGNIIFEYVHFDTELQAMYKLPAGVTTATRVTAYFMSAQTPESNPLPIADVCNNLETTKEWPLHVGTPHTDLDVGTLTMIGKNAAGTAVSFDVPKQLAGKDQIGRPHDIFYQVFTPNAPDLLKPNSCYDVKFGGSATVPARTFQQAIYLAADYPSVQNPDMENNGPLKADVDFPVAWTAGNSTNKPPPYWLIGGDVLGVTWLLDMTGSPTHMCVVRASAQAFTIPGATIKEFKDAAAARGQPTNQLIMLRSALAHQIVALPVTTGAAANKRRIDMLSLESWAQLMDVQ